MSTGNELWQPGDDGADGAADPDVEWALFGAHAIEYWVVRDGRLVPADGSELECIAERERERAAEARLLRWEREQRRARSPGVVARFVWRCYALFRRGSGHGRPASASATEDHGGSLPRHWSDVAPR